MMKTTIFAVTALLALFCTAITDAQDCAFDPAYQSIGCPDLPDFPIIGNVHAVAIFCCPKSKQSTSLPTYWDDIHDMRYFYQQVSNQQHNLTIETLTDGSNLYRSAYDYPKTNNTYNTMLAPI